MPGKTTALNDVIAQIRKRISTYVGNRISEEDTKFKLINPIIDSLGWNLVNIDEVRLEYRHESHHNPVDYAFFHQGKPVLFLEAKALSRDIDDTKWIGQTLKYAFEADVEWCVLTNGREYRIYRTYAKGKVRDKLFKAINIVEDDNLGELSYFLNLITKQSILKGEITSQWKTSSVDQRVKEALEKLVSNQDEGLVRLLVKRTENVSPAEIRQSLARAKTEVVFRFDEYTQSAFKTRMEAKKKTKTTSASVSSVSLKMLVDSGLVSLPLNVENTYKGHLLKARIVNESVVEFNGRRYKSLSISAGMARATIIGPRSPEKAYHSTNGWSFWKFHDPQTDELIPMDTLRQKFLEKGNRAFKVM